MAASKLNAQEQALCILIGRNIREARRRQARMRQMDLAERSGVAYRHLQSIEAGQVNVSVSTLLRLASALHCTVSYLVTPGHA